LAKSRPKGGRRFLPLLLLLRWLAVAVVIACLLDPQWVQVIKHQAKSRVAVLLDTSRSMSTKDVPEGRLGSGRKWLQERLAPIMPPNVSVGFYSFNRSLSPLASMDSASPTGA